MKTTLDEMRAFVTIADVGSLTRAAQKLHQPTSVMSRLLRRLEQKLDTRLIRRTTRSLELTEEGQIFLEDAGTILASVEIAEEQTVSYRMQPAGRLRVNAATPFMQRCDCLGDYMATEVRRQGSLAELLVDDKVQLFRPIHAVYYRNTRRITTAAIAGRGRSLCGHRTCRPWLAGLHVDLPARVDVGKVRRRACADDRAVSLD